MKHETFRDAAIYQAFDVIEGRVLPSLAFLIDRASGAEPGVDAAARASDIRRLAAELDDLQALFDLAGLPHA